ncbi:MAG: hypothetical protein N3E41_08590 [Thermofilaceae archaeon]|nr:hypothetical protein [Thermofilaceae archaeon]
MKCTFGLLFFSILLSTSIVYSEGAFLEALRLLEELSSEGVDVSFQVRELNRALELYRGNLTAEAGAIVTRVLQQLTELKRELPTFKFWKWLDVGSRVAILLAIPPAFYYFFPRLYALAWAYSRRNWLAKEVKKKNDSRR